MREQTAQVSFSLRATDGSKVGQKHAPEGEGRHRDLRNPEEEGDALADQEDRPQGAQPQLLPQRQAGSQRGATHCQQEQDCQIGPQRGGNSGGVEGGRELESETGKREGPDKATSRARERPTSPKRHDIPIAEVRRIVPEQKPLDEVTLREADKHNIDDQLSQGGQVSPDRKRIHQLKYQSQQRLQSPLQHQGSTAR